MKKSLVLSAVTILLLSAVLAGCPPPRGRHAPVPMPVPMPVPHPPVPHR